MIVFDQFTERDRANRQFIARTRSKRVRITEKEAADLFEQVVTSWQSVDDTGWFWTERGVVFHELSANRFYLVEL